MKVWIYRNFVTSHLLDINIRIEKEFSTSLASRIVDPHPPKMSNRTEGETYRDQIHAPHSHDPNRSSPLLLLHGFCEVHEACWRMFRCDYLLQLFNKKLSRTEDLNLFSFLNYLHIFIYLRFKECSLVSHEMFLLIFFFFRYERSHELFRMYLWYTGDAIKFASVPFKERICQVTIHFTTNLTSYNYLKSKVDEQVKVNA